MHSARHPWFEGLPPRYIIAHRGASASRPENTLESFREALRMGAQVLELDVHLSADGHLVVVHDFTVDRMTNGSGPVAGMKLADLRRLDAGFGFTPDEGRSYPWRDRGLQIPTFAEVMDAFPDTRLLVEIKPASVETARELARMLVDRRAEERVIVGSFHDAALRVFRTVAPRFGTGAGSAEARRFVIMSRLGLARLCPTPYAALQLPEVQGSYRVVTPPLVQRALGRNLHLQVWTVNDADHMRSLYSMGVQAVTTDYPDLAGRLLTG